MLADLKDNITISSPSGTRVHKSGTISLLCQPPKGFPEPTVTWMKDGIAVTTSDDGRVQINEDANSSMIVIQVAILSDSASYQCVAINVAGMKESATIPVTVFGEFTIYKYYFNHVFYLINPFVHTYEKKNPLRFTISCTFFLNTVGWKCEFAVSHSAIKCMFDAVLFLCCKQ